MRKLSPLFVLLVGCQLDTTPTYWSRPYTPVAGYPAPSAGRGGSGVAGRVAPNAGTGGAGRISIAGRGGVGGVAPKAGTGGITAPISGTGGILSAGGTGGDSEQGGMGGDTSIAGMGGSPEEGGSGGSVGGTGGTEEPPTVDDSVLQPDALVLNDTTFKPEDEITARVTYRNTSIIPYRVAEIFITMRRPGFSHLDSADDLDPTIKNRTVLGLGGVTLTASGKFSKNAPVGTWIIYPTYRDSSGAFHDGPETQVTVEKKDEVPPPEGGTGGSSEVDAGVPQGGTGGTEPMGGSGGTEPVGGSGGTAEVDAGTPLVDSGVASPPTDAGTSL